MMAFDCCLFATKYSNILLSKLLLYIPFNSLGHIGIGQVSIVTEVRACDYMPNHYTTKDLLCIMKYNMNFTAKFTFEVQSV